MFCVIEHSRVVIAFFIPKPRETPSKTQYSMKQCILSHNFVNSSNVFTECDQAWFSFSHISYLGIFVAYL